MLGSLLIPHNIWTANLLFLGLIQGLIIAVLAMGIVLIYRSSRVINFAVGAIGVPIAELMLFLVGGSGWPYWPSLLIVLAIGAATGAVIELVVIRRLFKAPRVIVLVATIGIAQLAQAVALIPAIHDRNGTNQTSFPTPMKSHWSLGSVSISGGQLLVLIVVPVIVVALWWLLGHTRFGESVRASATNADLARLTGVSPKIMSTAIWTIAGLLSTIAIILYATNQSSTELVQIGPQTLLFALTAALFGRMVSFPKTFAGAIFVGVVYQVFNYNVPNTAGLEEFILLLLVLVLVARMSRSDDSGAESFSFAPRVPAVPERLKELWWVRWMPRMIAGATAIIAVLLPFLVTLKSSQQILAELVAYTIAAVSITALTGWAGQLSLGQMAFAGIGGLSAAAFVRGMTLNVGWRAHRLAKGSLRPVPFWLGLTCLLLAVTAIGFVLQRGATRRQRLRAGGGFVVAIAAAVVLLPLGIDRSGTPHPLPFVPSLFLGAGLACVVAVAIGLGALRVRGLLLAISTFAFAIAAAKYIFPRPFLDPDGTGTVDINRGKLGPIDLAVNQRAFYWFALALLIIIITLMAHLRRTGYGRMIIGVRENEAGAAAFTVSATKAKLTTFALSGFLAGLAGALLASAVVNVGYTDHWFVIDDSLAVVSMAVIGGLGSLSGAVMGALWVFALPSFFSSNDIVPLLTSGIGLLIILLYIPGGFVQIGYWLRSALFNWLEQRLPERPVKTVTAPPAALTRVEAQPLTTNADGSVLATTGLTVQFGGLVAVNKVDFRALPGEVIGLIGTNGAGKSTLLNAIGGFVPSTGSIELMGTDVAHLPAYQRAKVGLGRTFQAATLFPELSVRETVELALEAREKTPFWGSLFYWSYRREHRKRREAAELIDYLGLGRYADRFVAELSTGTRRIVELACVLAVAPRVICLDEPTAGVAQREAEAFGPLIKRVQQELDATLIVVEHDMPLIMSISDRIYCLEAGGVIAEGTPAEVRENPQVVASYLGTDVRAIERSNAGT